MKFTIVASYSHGVMIAMYKRCQKNISTGIKIIKLQHNMYGGGLQQKHWRHSPDDVLPRQWPVT